MRRVRTMACVLVAIMLMVTLLSGSAFAATADSRRKIVILDSPLTQQVLDDLAEVGITVLYNLSLINALAVQLPPLPPPLPPLYLPVPDLALELLETLGEVYNDVLTFIDPICPTTAPPSLQEYRWGMEQIWADEAHRLWPDPSQTGAVTVAVLDTGIAASHSELIGRIAPGYNAITDTPGQPSDVHGHGTHMAGIITAAKNGVGVVGVAGVEPKIKVAAVKVLDDTGKGYLSVVMNGLQWVSNNGIRLLNMSFGFSFNGNDGIPLMQTIQELSTKGIIMVASAGNACCAGGVCEDGGGDDCGPGATCKPSGTSMTAPAAYPQVIAVGATNFYGQIADYSTYSGQGPEVLAPGGAPLPGVQDDGEILSTNNVGYGRGHGTSQAAAHVTGAIALALSLKSDLSIQEVRDLLGQNLNVQDMIDAIP